MLRLLTLCAAAGAASLVWAVPISSAAGRPLITAIAGEASYSGPDASLAFLRTRKKAGARLGRVSVVWASIAPAPHAAAKPPDFDPADPADPQYDWTEVDREVRLAAANGVKPVLGIYSAPLWAQDQSPHPDRYGGLPAGPYKPNLAEIAHFAHALAARYSGSFPGLPRVRYWRFWNEPNLVIYLSPQFEDGKPFAPEWYRLMLNAFAKAVHAVHRNNVVVAGSLAPFAHPGNTMAPLRFMRSLLCMSNGKDPRPVCSQRSRLDAFSVHPYTSGGPTDHASSANDVSLGDLPKVRRVLDAAARFHRIVSRAPAQLWVTEFSWDTRPPDPNPLAAPLYLQARWTAEALYRMWRSGVRVATWFRLRDARWPGSKFQSGLYFRSGVRMALDVPKPTLTAFRFPFVAYRQRHGTFVWGRTPAGRPARVIIEQRWSAGWKRLATLRSNRYGIFSAVLRKKIVRPPRPAPPAVPKPYRAAVLADSPTSYWRLGDQSGSTVRDLTGRRRAAAVGGVSFGAPGALLNDRNTAASFNGTDARIDLGPIDSPGTVELWVKTKGGANGMPLFCNRGPSPEFLDFEIFSRLAAVFDSFSLFGEQPIANDHWHYLVYTYKGVTGKLYVDGRLDASDTWIRAPGGDEASLGFDASNGNHFRGEIDEVAVYDRALTAAEVRKHFLASGRFTLARDFGTLRARLIGSRDPSLGFSLTRPRDRYVLPFGG